MPWKLCWCDRNSIRFVQRNLVSGLMEANRGATGVVKAMKGAVKTMKAQRRCSALGVMKDLKAHGWFD